MRLCCREAMKLMIEQKSGSIINISSVVGWRGYPNQAVQGSSLALIHFPVRPGIEIDSPEVASDPACCNMEVRERVLKLALLLEEAGRGEQRPSELLRPPPDPLGAEPEEGLELPGEVGKETLEAELLAQAGADLAVGHAGLHRLDAGRLRGTAASSHGR